MKGRNMFDLVMQVIQCSVSEGFFRAFTFGSKYVGELCVRSCPCVIFPWYHNNLVKPFRKLKVGVCCML